MQFFPPTLKTEQQIKDYYKILCKFYHPDMPGGDNDIMQMINQEYEQLEKNKFARVQQTRATGLGFGIDYKGEKYAIDNDKQLIDLFANILKSL